jgi:hypothetical protein
MAITQGGNPASTTNSAQHIVENMVEGRGQSSSNTAVGVKGVYACTATVDAASSTTGTSSETTVTITGVAAGDIVIATPPAAFNVGQQVSCIVSAANTVKVRVSNVTAGTVDPASGTWAFLWIDLT